MTLSVRQRCSKLPSDPWIPAKELSSVLIQNPLITGPGTGTTYDSSDAFQNISYRRRMTFSSRLHNTGFAVWMTRMEKMLCE